MGEVVNQQMCSALCPCDTATTTKWFTKTNEELKPFGREIALSEDCYNSGTSKNPNYIWRSSGDSCSSGENGSSRVAPASEGLVALVGVDAASAPGVKTFSIFKDCYDENIMGVAAAPAAADADADAAAAAPVSASDEVAAKANDYLSDV